MDEQRLNEIRARLAAYEAVRDALKSIVPPVEAQAAAWNLEDHAPTDIAFLLDALATMEAQRDHHHVALAYVRQTDPDAYQRALNDAARRGQRWGQMYEAALTRAEARAARLEMACREAAHILAQRDQGGWERRLLDTLNAALTEETR